jgi:PleD family two-component response regulator
VAAASFEITTSAVPLKITMSFGIAGQMGSSQTAAELMHNADTALYAAKLGGRNQVRVYSPMHYEALFGAGLVKRSTPNDKPTG